MYTWSNENDHLKVFLLIVLLFYCDFLCMEYFLHLITWLKTLIVQMEIWNYKDYELWIKLTFAAIQKNQKPNTVKEYDALR